MCSDSITSPHHDRKRHFNYNNLIINNHGHFDNNNIWLGHWPGGLLLDRVVLCVEVYITDRGCQIFLGTIQGKMYQIDSKLSNDHKMYQMAVIY
jgi:hypothetical protein